MTALALLLASCCHILVLNIKKIEGFKTDNLGNLPLRGFAIARVNSPGSI
jgi:hypothetical protein